MVPFFDGTIKTMPFEAKFAYAVTDEDGKVLYANGKFIDLVRAITQRPFNSRGVVGKTVREIFGKETRNTVIGTFLMQADRKPFTGNFMIGDRLYQVVVVEIIEGNNTYYEFFHFPLPEKQGNAKSHVLQNVVYQLAAKKGFADKDWILTTSDDHCKQLITCLINHEHTTTPVSCCPYKQRCKFNPENSWLQLDRRAYFRAKVSLHGRLYLIALKDRPVPQEIGRKMIPCQAQDLSIGGVKLAMHVSLPQESTVRVVFDEFTCEGTVMWAQKQKEEWLAGVKFIDINPEQHNSIIKVIAKSRL